MAKVTPTRQNHGDLFMLPRLTDWQHLGDGVWRFYVECPCCGEPRRYVR